MARTTKNIAIEDEEGVSHEYAIRKHGAIDAALLFARLTPAIGGALDGLRETAAPAILNAAREETAKREAAEKGAKQAPAEAPKVSASSESHYEILSAMLSAAPQVLMSIAQLADEDLIRELFKCTSRDGKALKSYALDEAYQDNLAEMLIAMGHIIRHNFERSIKRLMGKRLGAAASKLREKLPGGANDWQDALRH